MFIKKYWQEILLGIFILIAFVLRFYNITDLQFFTYDQSRDALFVKRMIIDHEFRLLGTQTSLPGMYLPPFYFYTITPILWLFKLNPIGIDIYSAFIGVLTVPMVYLVANKIFGKPAGVFSAGLFGVSPLVVELTRRAWNPNTLPFFILVSFYFLYRYFTEKKVKYFLLSFGFYGYCLSLHFGAWTLLPLFIFVLIYGWLKGKLSPLRPLGQGGSEARRLGVLGGLGILLFFVSPLFLFEIRHNFFLFNQAKVFFFDGGHLGPKSGVNFFESLIVSLAAIFTTLISAKISIGYGAPLEFVGKLKELFVLNQPISVVAQKPFSISIQWWGLLVFVMIVIYSILNFKTYKIPLTMLWIWVIWGVFASRMYSGGFFFFYYLFLFPAPILLFGFLGKTLCKTKTSTMISLLALLLLIMFHTKHTTVFAKNWRNFNDLINVAKTISNNIGSEQKFNLATIQRENDRWDRNAVDYRYFTESYFGKRALDWYPQNYREAEILFVIDETKETDPITSPIMEIQEFKPKSVIGEWELEKGIKIYKIDKRK